MRFCAGTFAIALGTMLLLQQASHAGNLKEHAALTKQAIIEFNGCVPEPMRISPAAQAPIESGVLSEDRNLPRKWVAFSHFYRPDRELRMRRYDSGTRVNHLIEEIYGNRWLTSISTSAIDDDVGNLIHQIQDMSYPPHTVPVMHANKDSYELFETSAQGTEDKCAFLKDTNHMDKMYPRIILDGIATRTLEALGEPLDVLMNGKPFRMTWSAFYQESGTDEFGKYGFAGNNFGQPEFRYGAVAYRVPLEAYRALKAARMRDAIESTKAILYWSRITIM